MPSLPDAIVPLLSPFASLFDIRTWRKAQILLTGVILAPGRRTVSTALYALGLQARGDFALFHHVLSRASWSSLAVSRVLCLCPAPSAAVRLSSTATEACRCHTTVSSDSALSTCRRTPWHIDRLRNRADYLTVMVTLPVPGTSPLD